MRIAFCSTCKDRVQHIEQTLPRNIADNADYDDCVFILVDYNSPDHLLQYLKDTHQSSIDSGRLVIYSYHGEEPFRMAYAKNIAHRLGILHGADILVNLDADNFTGPGFARYIADHFRRHGENTFMFARMVKGVMTRGINGRIITTRHAFLNVGGYDERYNTWSPDDKDFNLRLRRLGYIAHEIHPRFLEAIGHSDKMRFKYYTHVSSGDYDANLETIHSSDRIIVGYGHIGCCTVYKNFSEEETVLDPVPTRIFGIGMHKTATTSLHRALHILGIDTAHWTTAHWAKAIWEEMQAKGRSITLERSYAASDLPITILYDKLDSAYPGSKFILTTRHEDTWIESVRNHWDHDSNRFRAGWSTDPFTHRVHKLVYGQKGFEEQLFRARYRRHNSDVAEYFRDRPQDLLVMDMDNGAGWGELCGFLGLPIPNAPYPRAYKTKK